jgi:hypothetical protein
MVTAREIGVRVKAMPLQTSQLLPMNVTVHAARAAAAAAAAAAAD